MICVHCQSTWDISCHESLWGPHRLQGSRRQRVRLVWTEADRWIAHQMRRNTSGSTNPPYLSQDTCNLSGGDSTAISIPRAGAGATPPPITPYEMFRGGWERGTSSLSGPKASILRRIARSHNASAAKDRIYLEIFLTKLIVVQ